MPGISVIVPAYNSEQTIERCVRSVLSQTFSDFELIVVDDKSTDVTLGLLSRFRDPRLSVLVHDRNKGVSAARNLGLVAARSDIICFLDSDDEYLPDKLSTVYDFFGRNPDIDVLVDSFEIHFPESSTRATKGRVNPDLEDSESVRRAVYCREIYKATPAISVRRRALAAAGPFDEGMRRREDMEMLIRLTHVARCASTSRVLWIKHWQDNSLSWPVETFMDSLVDVASRHEEYLTEPAYARGLAHDLARHFLRLVGKGRLRLLGADFRKFARRFGVTREMRLVLAGMTAQRRRRRAKPTLDRSPQRGLAKNGVRDPQ